MGPAAGGAEGKSAVLVDAGEAVIGGGKGGALEAGREGDTSDPAPYLDPDPDIDPEDRIDPAAVAARAAGPGGVLRSSDDLAAALSEIPLVDLSARGGF